MPAHLTVASWLGLGVYASATRHVHDPRRPFRRGLGAPGGDPNLSVAYGTHRGHEVLLGFTRDRPGASAVNIDPIGELIGALARGDVVGHYCMIRVAPSLLLGLVVHEHRSESGHPSLPRAPTGQPAFDARFDVYALAPPCVPALFARTGDGNDVVDVTLAACDAGASVRIEDTFVTIGLLRPLEDARSLAWALNIGIHIAERLTAARPAVPPPPWEPSIAAALQSLATARSLQLDRARLAATGSAPGVTTEVSLTTTIAGASRDPAYGIEVAARYPPLGVRLSVYPERAVPGFARIFLRDVKVGDAAFDAAFMVDAEKDAPVAQWLGPEVRARLLTMAAQAACVVVDDDHVGLHLVPVVQDPAALAYAYDDVVAVASGVARACRGGAPPEVGPYR